METKKFQEILKNHIKKCGYTQKSLAGEIGMTQPQVNNLISGREGFGAKNTPKFAVTLGIDPLWLSQICIAESVIVGVTPGTFADF